MQTEISQEMMKSMPQMEEKSRRGYYLISKSHYYHDFKIPNWSSCLRNNKVVEEFTLANHQHSKFLIEVYPNGCNEESMNYISARLVNLSSHEVTGQYRITIVKNDPLILNTQDIVHETIGTKTLTSDSNESSWSIPQLVLKSDLREKQCYTSEDMIHFRVDITLIDEPEFIPKNFNTISNISTISNVNSNISIPISTILLDIKKLYNNPMQSDITLSTHDFMSFYCHRVILCSRSAVLEAKFKSWNSKLLGGMFKKVYMIKNVSGVVLGELIRFIYTDTCKLDMLDAMVYDILSVAVKYQVFGLIAICEDHIITNFSDSNLVVAFTVAKNFNLHRLIKACKCYYSFHTSVVESSMTYQNLNEELKNSLLETDSVKVNLNSEFSNTKAIENFLEISDKMNDEMMVLPQENAVKDEKEGEEEKDVNSMEVIGITPLKSQSQLKEKIDYPHQLGDYQPLSILSGNERILCLNFVNLGSSQG